MVTNKEIRWENAAITQEHEWEWREHFRRFCLRQNILNLLTGYAGKGSKDIFRTKNPETKDKERGRRGERM